MVNRNQGSGTRVLIDRLLGGARPHGYAVQPRNHNAVAAAVVQGRADWGMTLDTIARSAGLGFLPVQAEQYDFIVPRSRADRPGVVAFQALLQQAIHARGAGAPGNETGMKHDCGRNCFVRRKIDPNGCSQSYAALRSRDDAAARGAAAGHRGLARSWPSRRASRCCRSCRTASSSLATNARQRGPLEGLRAGLKALPESVDIAYVTSCDVPLLVPGFVTRMIELLGDHDIAVMEIDGFPHPLSAVYRRNTLPQVEALLAQGQAAAGVSVRCRAHPPRAAGGDGLRRSGTPHAAESEYAGRTMPRALSDAGLPRRGCRR